MTSFGYTLMTEQRGPRDLVADAVGAERAGFDFAVISDHYFPAVVAQKAATVALLSEGRFTLGLGSGENLNEHVVGQGWPAADVRQDMLDEAVTIIRRLLAGGYVTHEGPHYRVDSARLWDLPDTGVPLALAVSGAQSVERYAPVADAMVAVEPEPGLVERWDTSAGAGLPKIGQQPTSWGPDTEAATDRAHALFRWFGGGWKVNAELPGPAGFDAATQFVRRDDVATAIPCGPDVSAHVEAVRPFVVARFTHVALVEIGGEMQPDYLGFARSTLLPALREEYGEPDDSTIGVRHDRLAPGDPYPREPDDHDLTDDEGGPA